MSDYEIYEDSDGVILFVNKDGMAIPSSVLDLAIELNKQNSAFYIKWIELAEQYVFSGSSMLEA